MELIIDMLNFLKGYKGSLKPENGDYMSNIVSTEKNEEEWRRMEKNGEECGPFMGGKVM